MNYIPAIAVLCTAVSEPTFHFNGIDPDGIPIPRHPDAVGERTTQPLCRTPSAYLARGSFLWRALSRPHPCSADLNCRFCKFASAQALHRERDAVPDAAGCIFPGDPLSTRCCGWLVMQMDMLPAKLSPTRYLPSARNEPTAIRSRAFAHRRRAAGERVAPTLAQPGRAGPADHGAGSGAGPHRTGADRAAAGSMTNERLLSRELSAAGGRRSSAAMSPSRLGCCRTATDIGNF